MRENLIARFVVVILIWILWIFVSPEVNLLS